ncbi:hypothetical protein L9F63_006782, partial [Diploptera punctata]
PMQPFKSPRATTHWLFKAHAHHFLLCVNHVVLFSHFAIKYTQALDCKIVTAVPVTKRKIFLAIKEKNMRLFSFLWSYVSVLSDDISIVKDECLNHISKRLNTGLKNVVIEWRIKETMMKSAVFAALYH